MKHTGFRKKFWILGTLLLVILSGCSYDGDSTIAIPDGSHSNIPVTGKVWNSHAEEYVTLEGNIHILSQDTANGEEKKLHVNLQGVTGTGEQTGETYRVVGAGNSSNGTLTVTYPFYGPEYSTTLRCVSKNYNIQTPVNVLVYEDENGELMVKVEPAE